MIPPLIVATHRTTKRRKKKKCSSMAIIGGDGEKMLDMITCLMEITGGSKELELGRVRRAMGVINTQIITQLLNRWLDCGGDGESSRICQRNKGLFIKYGTGLFDTIIDTLKYLAPLAVVPVIAKQFRPDNTSQVMASLYSIIGAILQYAPSGNEYDQILRPRFYGCPPQSNEARWAYNGCCSGAIFQFPSYNSNFGLCTEQFGGTKTYRTQFEEQKGSKSGWFNDMEQPLVKFGS